MNCELIADGALRGSTRVGWGMGLGCSIAQGGRGSDLVFGFQNRLLDFLELPSIGGRLIFLPFRSPYEIGRAVRMAQPQCRGKLSKGAPTEKGCHLASWRSAGN